MTASKRRYGDDTEVPASRTKQELDELLLKHGASQRGIFEEAGRGVCLFTMAGRQVRLQVHLPGINTRPDPAPRGWYTWKEARQREWVEKQVAQLHRAAWRRLLLVTRAKLELVRDGQTVEREFLADLVLPDGATVHERLEKQIRDSYETGAMPRLLGPG